MSRIPKTLTHGLDSTYIADTFISGFNEITTIYGASKEEARNVLPLYLNSHLR